MNTFVNTRHLTNIANAVREKNSTTNIYKPSELAAQISSISDPLTITVLCTAGAVVTVTADDGTVVSSEIASDNTIIVAVPYAGKYIVSLRAGSTMRCVVDVVDNYTVSFVDPILENNMPLHLSDY